MLVNQFSALLFFLSLYASSQYVATQSTSPAPISKSFIERLWDLLPSASHHHQVHHGGHPKDQHREEEHAMKQYDFGREYGKWKGGDERWDDNKKKQAARRENRDRFGRQKYIKHHDKNNHMEYHRKKQGKFMKNDGKKFHHHEDKGSGKDKKWHWDRAGQKTKKWGDEKDVDDRQRISNKKREYHRHSYSDEDEDAKGNGGEDYGFRSNNRDHHARHSNKYGNGAQNRNFGYHGHKGKYHHKYDHHNPHDSHDHWGAK